MPLDMDMYDQLYQSGKIDQATYDYAAQKYREQTSSDDPNLLASNQPPLTADHPPIDPPAPDPIDSMPPAQGEPPIPPNRLQGYQESPPAAPTPTTVAPIPPPAPFMQAPQSIEEYEKNQKMADSAAASNPVISQPSVPQPAVPQPAAPKPAITNQVVANINNAPEKNDTAYFQPGVGGPGFYVDNKTGQRLHPYDPKVIRRRQKDGELPSELDASNPLDRAVAFNIDNANANSQFAKDQAKRIEENGLELKQQMQKFNDESSKLDDEARAARNEAWSETKKLIDEKNRLDNEILNTKIDPNRAWDSKSTGDKIWMALGLAMEGFSKGTSGAKSEDYSTNLLSREIEKDLKIQEQELSNKRSVSASKGNTIKLFMEAGNNREDAIKNARIALTQRYQNGLHQTAMIFENENAKAAALNTAAELGRKADGELIQRDLDRYKQGIAMASQAGSKDKEARAAYLKLVGEKAYSPEDAAKIISFAYSGSNSKSPSLSGITPKTSESSKQFEEDASYQRDMEGAFRAFDSAAEKMPSGRLSNWVGGIVQSEDQRDYDAHIQQLVQFARGSRDNSDKDRDAIEAGYTPAPGDTKQSLERKRKALILQLNSKHAAAATRARANKQKTENLTTEAYGK